MPSFEKKTPAAHLNFDLIFAKLNDPENVEIVRVNTEISKEAETIRLLREAAGSDDTSPFVTYCS